MPYGCPNGTYYTTARLENHVTVIELVAGERPSGSSCSSWSATRGRCPLLSSVCTEVTCRRPTSFGRRRPRGSRAQCRPAAAAGRCSTKAATVVPRYVLSHQRAAAALRPVMPVDGLRGFVVMTTVALQRQAWSVSCRSSRRTESTLSRSGRLARLTAADFGRTRADDCLKPETTGWGGAATATY